MEKKKIALSLGILALIAACVVCGLFLLNNRSKSYGSVKIIETSGSVVVGKDDVEESDTGMNMNFVSGNKLIVK